MSTNPFRVYLARIAVVSFVSICGLAVAHAQTPPKPARQPHDHGAPTPPAKPPEDTKQEGAASDHSQMMHGQSGAMSAAREGSGTAWLPDASPMYALHRQRGAWELMAHTNGFTQFLYDAGDRGHDQVGSINWVMGMAHRTVAGGRFGLRGMVSLEPWTIRGCGYPDLLASGERCKGEPIHDQQHQHDLFMEIAAQYDRPLAGSVRWQVYGGPAAEPALGPVAYPHRISAMPNLLAPIAHHWLDATHITFGVVTGSLYGNRWKTEASAFNGREPDEERTNFDLAALDSVSGRVWFLPTPNFAIQVSAGRLRDAEPSDDGSRIDVTRATASVTYHRTFSDTNIWASTLAWGRNSESDHASNAMLVETNVTLDERNAWFGRFEVVGKSAHDLDVDQEGTFTVGKLQGGYTRYLGTWMGLKPGLGVSASAGLVPNSLKGVYGSRVNAGFGVFLTVRPAAMTMMQHSPGAAMPGAAPMDHLKMKMPEHEHSAPAQTAPPKAPAATAKPPVPGDPRLPVLPVERVIDPACADRIDLTNAPRATHEGKVYYFCSAADREEFLKDPATYLKKRGQ
jgi:YHS domain-containing protein